jgi:CHASE1-domain containing sensor protein
MPGLAQGTTARRSPAFPWVAFGISIALTILIALYVRRTLEAREEARFENAVQATQDRIRQRLDTYVAVLTATSALYSANEHVSRAQFKAYAEGLSLRIRYPGIQALAYSVQTKAEEGPALVQRMREQGEPAFQMWPATGEPKTTTTVVYIEPHDRRNLRVLGYDLSSESARREALFRARDSGQAAVSRRLTLIQEIDERKQPGFLILIPVYRGGRTPATVDERRATSLARSGRPICSRGSSAPRTSHASISRCTTRLPSTRRACSIGLLRSCSAPICGRSGTPLSDWAEASGP